MAKEKETEMAKSLGTDLRRNGCRPIYVRNCKIQAMSGNRRFVSFLQISQKESVCND